MSGSGGRVLNRRRASVEIAALALGALPLMGRISRANLDSPVMMIEEDWTLVIGRPDVGNHAPGVKLIMSTQSDLLGYSADYLINHHKEGNPPAFAAGGFGIEVYSPDQTLPELQVSSDESKLATVGETLTWTQRLKLADGSLAFSIQNSNSTTWGAQTGEVLTSSVTCTLSDLSSYDSAFSVAQSGPVWWPSRVTSLTLVAVRYYDSTGKLLRADPLPSVAFP